MDPLRIHVRKILRCEAAADSGFEDRLRKLEAAGHRIITGGPNQDGTWEVLDWRTRELIAEGDGGLEGYDAAAQRLDPNGRWYHYEAVLDEMEFPKASPTAGIPPSLATALDEWVASPATPSEEIAEIADWTIEQVDACRD